LREDLQRFVKEHQIQAEMSKATLSVLFQDDTPASTDSSESASNDK
jgi:hypothetical protein